MILWKRMHLSIGYLELLPLCALPSFSHLPFIIKSPRPQLIGRSWNNLRIIIKSRLLTQPKESEKYMKKYGMSLFALLFAILFTGCNNYVNIPAGFIGKILTPTGWTKGIIEAGQVDLGTPSDDNQIG